MENRVGVFLHSLALPLEEAIKAAGRTGFKIAQLGPVEDKYLSGDHLEAKREELVELLNKNEIKVGPLCVCYEHGVNEKGGAESYADIEEIAATGGYGYERLDAPQIVAERIELTKQHIDLAKYLQEQGVMSSEKAVLTTHAGFFHRQEKREQIKNAVCEIVRYCQEKDAYFAIETGSEEMTDLIGFIKEVETETGIHGRLGINYDPANFLMYGTQDPLEALKVLKQDDNKKYLFGVHIKDAKGDIVGEAKGSWKGEEEPFGKGCVDFAKTLPLLHELGYRDHLIVEREGGNTRMRDITYAYLYLETMRMQFVG